MQEALGPRAFAARSLGPLTLGILGVTCFSLTLPATTAAENSFSAVEIGAGRSVIAAVLAIAVLSFRGERLLPPRAAVRRVLVVAGPVGIGFGLLTALALRDVSSAHGAVLTGLIPAATAGMAVLRAGERPRPAYWAALGIGLAVVAGFAIAQGGGRLRPADLVLLAAVAIAGVGYAEGGLLAREYGGWRVICWVVVIALPVTVPLTIAAALTAPARPLTIGALLGLVYQGTFSMCIGFFAWYQAMALGGVARIGLLQLAQPVLTLGWSVLLLGEHVSLLTALCALGVIAATAVGRTARVDQRPIPIQRDALAPVIVLACPVPHRSSRPEDAR
jgi:drug/metabolite transporter (DMT)-like permease